MSSLMYRIGRITALHPWRTICAWLVVAFAIFAIAAATGGKPQDNYDVPGTQSQAGLEQLREHFPDASGATAQVVLHDPDGQPIDQASIDSLGDELATVDHVSAVAPPRMSEDGATALYHLQYDVDVTNSEVMGNVEALEDAADQADIAGYDVDYGGEVPSSSVEVAGQGEMIGIIVALILLVLTFGSVIAAGMPIIVALSGLVIGSAGITILASTMDVSTSAPTIASMVGLGVGIDYALLLITRHVEYLRAGHDPVESAARANATAGRSVIFAGSTVLVSLMGLPLAGLPTYSSFGFATGIAVAIVMAAAVTLVPALSRLAGRKLMPRRERKGRAVVRKEGHQTLTARWAAMVGRRPVVWALTSLVTLLVLAAPVLGMRTWPQDPSSDPQDSTTRQSFDQVADSYGAGANGPLTFVADLDQVTPAQLDQVRDQIAGHEGIAAVSEPVTSPDGAAAMMTAEPEFGPSDERTGELISSLRSDVLPDGVEVTGMTALLSDASEMLADRIWIVIGFVVLVSVLLLAMMFRSVIVPIKAAAMNLLSIGAAYGVMTMVFQHGWGASLFGIDHEIPVSSWVPILMFAVLFGLSMDYEVFLLSRVREEWLRSGDARASVVRGLASTGRVISAAAAIMVAVFLGFATESNVIVKMTGVGMAVAIALDATLVRMVLVPATMSLLGKWNWWLPSWIDRWLPHVDAEVDWADEPTTISEKPVPASVNA